jgi:hypothetical protein
MATHAVPVVHFVEAGTGNDKGQGLELALLVLLHREREDPWTLVEGLDVLGIVAVLGELYNLELEVRTVAGTIAR